jgi:hypothetical protein
MCFKWIKKIKKMMLEYPSIILFTDDSEFLQEESDKVISEQRFKEMIESF